MAASSVTEKRMDAHYKAGRWYRPELDCLRFFAFFAVYIYHTMSGDAAYYSARHIPFATLVASAASAGRFGVDLFFLLSAFLITELLLREQEEYGTVDIRSFYVRRILRIWPLYFLGLLIGLLVPLFDASEYFPVKYAAAFVFMFGNWLPVLGFRLQSVMWPLWSVSLEEQFYLMWGAFIYKSSGRRMLLCAAAVLLVVAPVSRLLLLPMARERHSEVVVSSNTFARLEPLALGIASATLLSKRRQSFGWAWRLCFLAGGCVLWLTAGHFLNLTKSFMLLGYPAIALGALLIFLSVFGSPLAPGWLRYLGKISYGLYVFHLLAIHYSIRLLGGQVHTLRAFSAYWSLGLASTLVLAALSYRYFESPFLRLKERFTRIQSRPV
jgi:peptidoglycan/LPS O-acetylase OafA/YrhL